MAIINCCLHDRLYNYLLVFVDAFVLFCAFCCYPITALDLLTLFITICIRSISRNLLYAIAVMVADSSSS